MGIFTIFLLCLAASAVIDGRAISISRPVPVRPILRQQQRPAYRAAIRPILPTRQSAPPPASRQRPIYGGRSPLPSNGQRLTTPSNVIQSSPAGSFSSKISRQTLRQPLRPGTSNSLGSLPPNNSPLSRPKTISNPPLGSNIPHGHSPIQPIGRPSGPSPALLNTQQSIARPSNPSPALANAALNGPRNPPSMQQANQWNRQPSIPQQQGTQIPPQSTNQWNRQPSMPNPQNPQGTQIPPMQQGSQWNRQQSISNPEGPPQIPSQPTSQFNRQQSISNPQEPRQIPPQSESPSNRQQSSVQSTSPSQNTRPPLSESPDLRRQNSIVENEPQPSGSARQQQQNNAHLSEEERERRQMLQMQKLELMQNLAQSLTVDQSVQSFTQFKTTQMESQAQIAQMQLQTQQAQAQARAQNNAQLMQNAQSNVIQPNSGGLRQSGGVPNNDQGMPSYGQGVPNNGQGQIYDDQGYPDSDPSYANVNADPRSQGQAYRPGNQVPPQSATHRSPR